MLRMVSQHGITVRLGHPGSQQTLNAAQPHIGIRRVAAGRCSSSRAPIQRVVCRRRDDHGAQREGHVHAACAACTAGTAGAGSASSWPLFDRAGKMTASPLGRRSPGAALRVLERRPKPRRQPRRAACSTSCLLRLCRTCEGHQPKAAAVGASPRHLELINDLHGPHLHGWVGMHGLGCIHGL